MFRLLIEQFNFIQYMDSINEPNLSAHDISKETIVQTINLIQCILQSQDSDLTVAKMVTLGIVELMH